MPFKMNFFPKKKRKIGSFFSFYFCFCRGTGVKNLSKNRRSKEKITAFIKSKNLNKFFENVSEDFLLVLSRSGKFLNIFEMKALLLKTYNFQFRCNTVVGPLESIAD
jgi:hypothetical protein